MAGRVPAGVAVTHPSGRGKYLEYLYQMTGSGYRLFGLVTDEELTAVAGVDILTNMYYGRHLWVFELVTDADRRSEGFGTRLLGRLTEWVESRGCEKVALSSGVRRTDAHRFYERRVGMDKASYVYTLTLG